MKTIITRKDIEELTGLSEHEKVRRGIVLHDSLRNELRDISSLEDLELMFKQEFERSKDKGKYSEKAFIKIELEKISLIKDYFVECFISVEMPDTFNKLESYCCFLEEYASELESENKIVQTIVELEIVQTIVEPEIVQTIVEPEIVQTIVEPEIVQTKVNNNIYEFDRDMMDKIFNYCSRDETAIFNSSIKSEDFMKAIRTANFKPLIENVKDNCIVKGKALISILKESKEITSNGGDWYDDAAKSIGISKSDISANKGPVKEWVVGLLSRDKKNKGVIEKEKEERDKREKLNKGFPESLNAKLSPGPPQLKE